MSLGMDVSEDGTDMRATGQKNSRRLQSRATSLPETRSYFLRLRGLITRS